VSLLARRKKRCEIIGLVCRISSLLKGSSAKETYNFKEPTNQEEKRDLSLFFSLFSLVLCAIHFFSFIYPPV